MPHVLPSKLLMTLYRWKWNNGLYSKHNEIIERHEFASRLTSLYIQAVSRSRATDVSDGADGSIARGGDEKK